MPVETFPACTVVVSCDAPECACQIQATEQTKHEALIAITYRGWRQVAGEWFCGCRTCVERRWVARA